MVEIYVGWADFFAFNVLLKAIANGANTPDSLAKTIEEMVSSNPNNSFSQSFITSQRSGALSRMADLSLIVRERSGVRVSYVMTESGRNYVDTK